MRHSRGYWYGRLFELVSWALVIAAIFSIADLCAQVARSDAIPTPIKWTVERSRPARLDIPIDRGESVNIMPSFVDYNVPVNLSNVSTIALYYRSTVETNLHAVFGTLTTNAGEICIPWTSAAELTSSIYQYWIVISGLTNVSIRQEGSITMKDTWGHVAPSTNPPSLQTIDFATVALFNPGLAPWATLSDVDALIQGVGGYADDVSWRGRTNDWNSVSNKPDFGWVSDLVSHHPGVTNHASLDQTTLNANPDFVHVSQAVADRAANAVTPDDLPWLGSIQQDHRIIVVTDANGADGGALGVYAYTNGALNAPGGYMLETLGWGGQIHDSQSPYASLYSSGFNFPGIPGDWVDVYSGTKAIHVEYGATTNWTGTPGTTLLLSGGVFLDSTFSGDGRGLTNISDALARSELTALHTQKADTAVMGGVTYVCSNGTFFLPVVAGMPGHDGSNGAPGVTPTITFTAPITGSPDTPVALTNYGDSTNLIIQLTVPSGRTGPTGIQGPPGHAVTNITIVVSTNLVISEIQYTITNVSVSGGSGTYTNTSINGIANTAGVALADSPSSSWSLSNGMWYLNAQIPSSWSSPTNLQWIIGGNSIGYADTNGITLTQGSLTLYQEDLTCNVRLYDGSRNAPSLTLQGHPGTIGLFGRGYAGTWGLGWADSGNEVGVIYSRGIKLLSTNAAFSGLYYGDISNTTNYPEGIFTNWLASPSYPKITVSSGGVINVMSPIFPTLVPRISLAGSNGVISVMDDSQIQRMKIDGLNSSITIKDAGGSTRFILDATTAFFSGVMTQYTVNAARTVTITNVITVSSGLIKSWIQQ